MAFDSELPIRNHRVATRVCLTRRGPKPRPRCRGLTRRGLRGRVRSAALDSPNRPSIMLVSNTGVPHRDAAIAHHHSRRIRASSTTGTTGLQLSPGARHSPPFARQPTSRRPSQFAIAGRTVSGTARARITHRVNSRCDAQSLGGSRWRSRSISKTSRVVHDPWIAPRLSRFQAEGCSPNTTHGHALRTILGRLRASEAAAILQPGV